jgi:hypothetical protein
MKTLAPWGRGGTARRRGPPALRIVGVRELHWEPPAWLSSRASNRQFSKRPDRAAGRGVGPALPDPSREIRANGKAHGKVVPPPWALGSSAYDAGLNLLARLTAWRTGANHPRDRQTRALPNLHQ